MMKIATEEAFLTPAVAEAWRKLLDAERGAGRAASN